MTYENKTYLNKKYRKCISRLRYNVLSGYYDGLDNYASVQEKKAVKLIQKLKKRIEETNTYDINPKPF